ncbi:cardiolipin synthase [Lysobacter helvus]|uniref:Cardiolipin synthase n=2 Tax=Lysobacteraceae TaxID=32033 RepID=A0ABN6FTD5_9GAMM|nr:MULTISPECIES: cardiolipin synthase [Lysobacter]BCT92205.1 cardiolipin synthase [Lysobacter caseinilyticus]BCT95358.1 cardiolipin synthase [Lysobacter helvus]
MLATLVAAWHWLLAIPNLGVYLTVGWAAYLVGLGSWIVLQKREPAATMSWLLGLALLPYVGFIIYHYLGPQRITRHRIRRARSRAPKLSATTPGDLIARELSRLGVSTTSLPPTTATDVRLLLDGGAKYTALLEDVAKAQHSIDVEYYIFLADRTGTALRDALIERAAAGVQVRLLLDAVGSAKTKSRFFDPLLEAGGQFSWFHPMRLGRFWRRPWLNMRTHRKIVVIDGCIGYTGGINVTDEEDERLRSDAYRDVHVRVEGEVTRALQAVFVEDWAYATGHPPVMPPAPAFATGDYPVQVVASGPDSPWEAIHRLHVGAIHSAQRRVWLTTPYFVPGEAAMMALTSAALGGLDVRLLVPKMSDSKLVTYAARSYFDDLLAAGVRVYEYGPRLLHSKTLLVDDTLAIIGSANFDHRSFRLNFEVSLLFHDARVASELERVIELDFALAPRVRDDRARPLWRSRLPEALARLVSPLL